MPSQDLRCVTTFVDAYQAQTPCSPGSPPSLILLAVRSPVQHLGRFDPSEEAYSLPHRCRAFLYTPMVRLSIHPRIVALSTRRQISSKRLIVDEFAFRYIGIDVLRSPSFSETWMLPMSTVNELYPTPRELHALTLPSTDFDCRLRRHF